MLHGYGNVNAALRYALLGALALGFMSSASAANRPKGWVTICKEGASCSVPADTNVAFGRADQFFYKVLSGSFVCNEATFGGKIAGGVNECSTATGTTSSSSSSAASSSSSKSSSSSSSSKTSSSSSSRSSSSSSSVQSSSSSSAASQTAMLDLSRYKLTATYSLSSKAAEASAVSWNWDTDTLFVIGDEGKAVVQLDKQGKQLDTTTLSGFSDTESLSYIGSGKFVLAEERLQTAYVFTYAAGSTVKRSSLPYAVLGETVDNIGIEGICYDRLADNYVVVKEKSPQAIYGATIDFANKVATTKSLFSPDLLKLTDLSDVQTLGSVTSLNGTAKNNLLVLSQESAMLVETTRSGSILSKLDLSSISDDIEGVTIDRNGTIYLVAQTPKLYVLTPR